MRLSKKAAEAEKEADLAQSDLDRAASRIISASSPFSGSCAVIWDPLICVKNLSPLGKRHTCAATQVRSLARAWGLSRMGEAHEWNGHAVRPRHQSRRRHGNMERERKRLFV